MYIGLTFIVTITIGGVIVLKIFLSGSVMPAERILITEVSVNESSVYIQGDFVHDSALAYKGFKYRVDGQKLFIKVYSVVVSPFHKYGRVDISIIDDFSNIQEVYLEDNSKQLQIFEKHI